MPLKLYGDIGCAAVNSGSIDQLDPFLQADNQLVLSECIGKASSAQP